ncbi:efflux RND transporter periplasmic adaptor subunit [Paraflavitalea sp. CAU 1676]|uniref:efflux RND transporter periplasmic adaptor subunit n=1 Tax=Paraflavitalea sp. CAU 1676 TaxID=3032598 RepID=UPI0023D98D10|nr:efflux RND transporter periplasmic adaptor subunit [Paraflavitalea sp. CAU 1676]MDF2187492.1 efflux RND transporter periplasmic adaptor subunit [Paraflavitalea sp. CAU 1676]
MKKIFHSFRFLIIMAIAFTVARCNEETKAITQPVADNAITVKLQPVTDTTYAPVLRYSGAIASNSEATLSFKTGGIISRIYVKEGDHVLRGQILATLDMTEINAQVQQAAQGAEKAERDAKRVKNLYNDTVATLEQLQNATTQQQISSEGLRIARFNQQYAQIRATENGTILKKIMNEGELAAPGAPVFFVNGNAGSDWVIRFGVSDKDWAVLRLGNKAEVSLDAYPHQPFTGIVSKIAEGADAANGTYEIEVKVLPNGVRFATGLFGVVQLQPSTLQRVTLIPIEALAEADGKSGFVYTVGKDQRTVQRHAVSIAFLEKDKVAIVKGLDNVQQVITDGVGYLTEKSVVNVIK